MAYFYFLIVFFEMPTFLILVKPSLSFFSLMDCTSVSYLGTLCLIHDWKDLFTSRSFCSVRFYIKVIDTCFELSFVRGER